eukprot:jgi/Botrbrau1/923/Bobra.0167s0036.1
MASESGLQNMDVDGVRFDLESLKPELLDRVLAEVDSRDLREMRLVARHFRQPPVERVTRLFLDIGNEDPLAPMFQKLPALTHLTLYRPTAAQLAEELSADNLQLPSRLQKLHLLVHWPADMPEEQLEVLADRFRGATRLTELKLQHCSGMPTKLLSAFPRVEELTLCGSTNPYEEILQAVPQMPALRRLVFSRCSKSVLARCPSPLPPCLAALELCDNGEEDDVDAMELVTRLTQLTRLSVEVGQTPRDLTHVYHMSWLRDLEIKCSGGRQSLVVNRHRLAGDSVRGLIAATGLTCLRLCSPSVLQDADLAQLRLPHLSTLAVTLQRGDLSPRQSVWAMLTVAAPALRSLSLVFPTLGDYRELVGDSPGLTALTSLEMAVFRSDYAFNGYIGDRNIFRVPYPTAAFATSNVNLQKLMLMEVLHIDNFSIDEPLLQALGKKNGLLVVLWQSSRVGRHPAISPKMLQRRCRLDDLYPFWDVCMDREE